MKCEFSNYSLLEENKRCSMGISINFMIKSTNSTCLNDISVNRKILFTDEICKCTQEDYECKPGFFKKDPESKCEMNDYMKSEKVNKFCLDQTFMTAYQKIEGNKCESEQLTLLEDYTIQCQHRKPILFLIYLAIFGLIVSILYFLCCRVIFFLLTIVVKNC